MKGLDTNAICAGQKAFGGCQEASASRDSCCTSSKSAEQTASRTPLPFPEWQARRLMYLDVQFLAWLTFTYVLYGVKTTKLLCNQAAGLSVSGQTCATAATGTPVYCNWAWQVACSSAAVSSRRGWLGAVPGVAWLRSQVLVAVKAATSPFFAAWMMSDYGIGISLIEMLLWVTVIFTPVLCRAYIRRPALRCTLLLVHRYAKLLGCWLSLGVLANDHVGLALMGYFMTVGQYAFSGWQNAMTLVPLKLFAVCGLAEWLWICHHIRSLRATYPAAALTHHSNAALYCMSFVLVYAVPMAVIAAVEHRHKKQYRLYAASFAPPAAAAAVVGVQQLHGDIIAADNAAAASTSTASAARDRGALYLTRGESVATCIDSCKTESVVSSSSSAGCRSSDRGGAGRPSSVRSSLECGADDAAGEGDAATAAVVEYLKPRLDALLGDGALAQIMDGIKTAAGRGTAPAAGAAGRGVYKAMCTTTNASVKVSTEHSSVATLGPLLHASLMSMLASNSSSSARPVVYSACLEGCVQMVALMYALKHEQQRRDPQQGNQGHTQTDEAANALLCSVQGTLAAAAGAGAGSAAVAQSAAVHVLWGDAFAARTAEHKETDSTLPQQQQQEIEPAEADPAAATVCSSCTTTAAAAGSAAPALRVVCIEPACLIADKPQTLQVQLRGSCARGVSGSRKYRLLAFKDNSMLVNQVVGVDRSDSFQTITAAVPATPSLGVLHVCLVPLAGPLRQQLSGVLHQPLLILPAAAAAEVKQLWGAADGKQAQQLEHDQAVWEAMAAISADVAFLIGGSSSSSGGGVIKAGRLSPDKAAVLKHLLVFLAQNACWETMKFVVDATAAAATAGQGSTLAVAAESPECTAALPALKATTSVTAAAQAAEHGELVQAPSTPKASRKLEHSTSNASSSSASSSNEDSCDACGGSYGKTPKASSKKTPQEAAVAAATAPGSAAHAPHMSAWQQAAAAELSGNSATDSSSNRTSSVRYSWRAAAGHLLFGFKCRGFEAAYLGSVAAQTRLSDIIAAVYHLVMALSFRVLTDDLTHSCSSNRRGCLFEALGRVLYFGLFTVPSLMLVVARTRLTMTGRREFAALLCEVCLCALPLLASMGVIRHGPYITAMYQSDSWHSLIIFWCGMGVYKMGCRQVRARLPLPVLVLECVLAIRWGLQIGSPVRCSLVKYGGVVLAATVAGAAFEVSSRRRFLLGVMATPAQQERES